MPHDISGLDLARAFYREAVLPILAAHFPRMPHSAALIGSGSEVLGYDDAVSRDHDWGPRLQLFLSSSDHRSHACAVSSCLRNNLPQRIRGYAINWSAPSQTPGDIGAQQPAPATSGEVNHRVEIMTIDDCMRAHFGFGIDHRLRAADWLSVPQQKLLAFTAGGLFHDELGLAAAQERFAWYPRDVWLYMLACGWMRIAQDEHLAPRAGAVGDELGSAVIAGRLVRSIMLLCFLMERRYAPYPKWLGSAFMRLDCGEELAPILRAAQLGKDFRERERHLCAAYATLNRLHNAMRLTDAISPVVVDFHERGFIVCDGGRYARAFVERIASLEVRQIANHALIGGIDQFSDNTDMREATHMRKRIAELYG